MVGQIVGEIWFAPHPPSPFDAGTLSECRLYSVVRSRLLRFCDLRSQRFFFWNSFFNNFCFFARVFLSLLRRVKGETVVPQNLVIATPSACSPVYKNNTSPHLKKYSPKKLSVAGRHWTCCAANFGALLCARSVCLVASSRAIRVKRL